MYGVKSQASSSGKRDDQVQTGRAIEWGKLSLSAPSYSGPRSQTLPGYITGTIIYLFQPTPPSWE